MNKKSDGENFNSTFNNLNRKRKFDEPSAVNKRLRINRSNLNEFPHNDKRTTIKSHLYYEPTPKVRRSSADKVPSPDNGQYVPRRYSANDRLKHLRRNLEDLPNPNLQNNNNGERTGRTSTNPKYIPSRHLHQTAVETARPSSLQDRINKIKHTIPIANFSFPPPPPKNIGYFTTSPPTNVTSPPESGNSFHNTSDDSDSMDWSYIEEKKVLSQISDLRNGKVITRVTPSTTFQECLAKDLMDIPNNDTILKDIYVIVDTNVFISHLDVIKDIINIKVNGVASPIILIPWIVIQELDYLKECRSDTKLKRKSQTAIHFINDKLTARHPQVKGQSVGDAAQQNFSSKCADDSILHCCLQIIEKQNRAMLLSNDINLRNKALINGVSSYSHIEIMNALNPYRGSITNFNSAKGKEIETYFKNLYSFIIYMQLKEAYGTSLNHMDAEVKNPPWTLPKCLSLFQRFWKPIFSMFLQGSSLHKIGQYSEFLNKIGSVDNVHPMDMKVFIDYGLAICVYLKNALPSYQDSISDCVNSVENIVKTLSLPDTFIKI